MKRLGLFLIALTSVSFTAAADNGDRKQIPARIELHPIQSLTLSDQQFLKGEAEGKPVTATLTFPYLTVKKAHRTNLVEENQQPLAFTPHTITAPVGAFGITTIRLQTR